MQSLYNANFSRIDDSLSALVKMAGITYRKHSGASKRGKIPKAGRAFGRVQIGNVPVRFQRINPLSYYRQIYMKVTSKLKFTPKLKVPWTEGHLWTEGYPLCFHLKYYVFI